MLRRNHGFTELRSVAAYLRINGFTELRKQASLELRNRRLTELRNMDQDTRWLKRYQEVVSFIETNHELGEGEQEGIECRFA